MKRYNGAIVDAQGFIIFEFRTKFCNNIKEAKDQARLIRDAMSSVYNFYDPIKWTLDETGDNHGF